MQTSREFFLKPSFIYTPSTTMQHAFNKFNRFLILCLYKKGQGCQSHLACFDTMLAQIKTKFFLFIVRTAPFWLTSALVSLMISIRGPVNPDSHYVTFFPSDCLAVLPGLLNHSLSMGTIMVNR